MPDTAKQESGSLPSPPAKTAKWLKYFLSFGVTVVVGLAPYLGKFHVPLFSPLLSFIPVYEQNSALILSSAAMGLVAVAVQWYGTESLTKKKMKRWFLVAMAASVGTFLALIAIHSFVTVPVELLTKETMYVVVGFEQPPRPPCEGLGDSDCIRLKLTLNPAAIETHYGQRRVRMASTELVLAYLAFTSSFAWLVALVVFKDG